MQTSCHQLDSSSPADGHGNYRFKGDLTNLNKGDLTEGPSTNYLKLFKIRNFQMQLEQFIQIWPDEFTESLLLFIPGGSDHPVESTI